MTGQEELDAVEVAALGLKFLTRSGTVEEWRATVLAGRALGFSPDVVLRLGRTAGVRTPAELADILSIGHDGAALGLRAREFPTVPIRVPPGSVKDKLEEDR